MSYSTFLKSGEANTVYFETSFEITYRIHFQSSDYLFPTLPELTGSVFEFVLAVAETTPIDYIPADPRIAPTVVAAIEQFLREGSHRVITYICDSSDRRELARKRKFDQWFATYAPPIFHKQEGQIVDTDGTQFFIAAIWHKDHSLSDQIATAFRGLSDNYNNEKPD